AQVASPSNNRVVSLSDSVSAGLVTGRAKDLLRALPRQHRRERVAVAPETTVVRRLVTRRTQDRIRAHHGPAGAWSVLLFGGVGYLRHERRREWNPQADAQRSPKRRTCLVSGRPKDRFPEHPKWQQGSLRHQR